MLRKVKIVVVALLWVFHTNASWAQQVEYRDMLAGTQHLFAIRLDGRLLVWSLDDMRRAYTSQDTSIHFTAIGQNHQQEVFLGTKDGHIFQMDLRDFSIRRVISLKRKIRVESIFFDRSGKMFLIVPYVFLDPIKHTFWNRFDHRKTPLGVKKKHWFFFKKRATRYFLSPKFSFVDSQDRVWMFNHFGEFGGAIQRFDMKKRKPVEWTDPDLNFGLLFPQSAFEDDQQQLYITSGVQHFGNSGEVFQVRQNKMVSILNGENFSDSTASIQDGLFIGPGAFHPVERKIYFATQKGFYRADLPVDSSMGKPEWVFSPEIQWNSEPLAIGYQMAVRKLLFLPDGQLLFLTATSGIGVYDGKKCRFLP
jgi:hypothetical protein